MAADKAGDEHSFPDYEQSYPASESDMGRSAAPNVARKQSVGLQVIGLIFYCCFAILQIPHRMAKALRSGNMLKELQTAANKSAGHLIIIGLGVIALWAAPLAAEQIAVRTVEEEYESYGAYPTFRANASEAVYPDVIERPLLLETKVILRPQDGILSYEVQGNDTLVDIASRFRITLDTLLWANDIAPDHLLYLGYKLRVPPVNGVVYEVARGDVLHEIAEKHESNPVAIAEYNRIGLSTTLVPGMELIIPNGVLPEALRKASSDTQLSQREQPVAAFGEFRWPTHGVITQYYHGRHLALDIGNRTGTPIVAADAGQVVVAGWSPIGYGNRIVINHGNGWVTTYNHLSTFAVSVGDFVKAGDIIGGMGNTGYSTGPHLHFEVLYQNRYRNPLELLS
jgi:hypothetical protein